MEKMTKNTSIRSWRRIRSWRSIRCWSRRKYRKKNMGEGGVDTLEIVFIIKNTFLKVKRRSGKEERENNENWEREKSWERHIQERVNYWGTSYKGLPSRPKQSLCASLLTRLTSPFPPEPFLLILPSTASFILNFDSFRESLQRSVYFKSIGGEHHFTFCTDVVDNADVKTGCNKNELPHWNDSIMR